VTALPQLEVWLAGLPAGWLSYPECEAKGSILRAMVSEPLYRALAPSLPDPLRLLVEYPPLATQWVPEVHQLGLLLAAAEGHFAHAGGEAAFLGWGDRSSLAMLRSPLYRALFAVAGPRRLLDGFEKKAGALRRGTTFKLLGQDTGWAEIELGFPTGLYNELLLKTRARTIRGAVEAAGGKHTVVKIAAATPTRAVFRVEYG
jgi:hypothetical protein